VSLTRPPAATRRRRCAARALASLAHAALALALGGCTGGLDPSVYQATGRPRPSPESRPPRVSTPAVRQPSFRGEPRGRWSDDGLRYEEHETTTGVPFLPWPLGRTRGGGR